MPQQQRRQLTPEEVLAFLNEKRQERMGGSPAQQVTSQIRPVAGPVRAPEPERQLMDGTPVPSPSVFNTAADRRMNFAADFEEDPLRFIDPMGGVTTFIGAAGRPAVAARQQATARNLAKLEAILRENLGWEGSRIDALTERILAPRHGVGRTLAHADDIRFDPQLQARGQMDYAGSPTTGRSAINVGPLADEQTLMEEIGHVAQGVGLKDRFPGAYMAANNLAQELRGNEYLNVIERGAKFGAMRRAPRGIEEAIKGMGATPRPVMQGLRDDLLSSYNQAGLPERNPAAMEDWLNRSLENYFESGRFHYGEAADNPFTRAADKDDPLARIEQIMQFLGREVQPVGRGTIPAGAADIPPDLGLPGDRLRDLLDAMEEAAANRRRR